jgi:hypothetical protein
MTTGVVPPNPFLSLIDGINQIDETNQTDEIDQIDNKIIQITKLRPLGLTLTTSGSP